MPVSSRPLPRPIPVGGRVGVMALSGPVPAGRLQPGLNLLKSEGFEVVTAPNVRRKRGYLAGDDDARLEGLGYLLDRDVDVLLAARGGYGAMRLLVRLPWDRLSTWGGWVVGFSDLTVLHAALATRFPYATVHGPMVTTLTRHAGSTRQLIDLLRGKAPNPLMRFGAAAVVRGGRARGPAVGGTLAILAALAATPFEPSYDGCVLFLEDVDEPLYRLDRLLTQLRLSHRLGAVKAVVAGRLTGCGRGEGGWRARWRELLVGSAGPGAVVVEGLPFGHGRVNTPIPMGGEVEVDTVRGTIRAVGA